MTPVDSALAVARETLRRRGGEEQRRAPGIPTLGDPAWSSVLDQELEPPFGVKWRLSHPDALQNLTANVVPGAFRPEPTTMSRPASAK